MIDIKDNIKQLPETTNLGGKIAFYRKQKGISQESLAQLIGKTRSTIAAYENNIADITIPVLRQLAKALDISLYDFVHDFDLGNQINNPGIGTFIDELQNQIRQLKMELESTKLELVARKKEIEDKDKIISLIEKREADIEKKDKQIEDKLDQMNNLYQMLLQRPTS